MKLIVIAFLVCSITLAAGEGLWCGQVFDGTEQGSDQSMLDAKSVGAYWRGFSANENGVSYHVAVVSASHPDLSLFNSRCVSKSVSADWTPAGRINSHTFAQSRLSAGDYHILVRATDDAGNFIISKSNGFAVARAPVASYDCATLGAICAEINDPRPLDIGHTRGPAPGTPAALAAAAAPTVFNFFPGELAVDHSGDDDDGYSAITQAGIAIGTIVGFSVLLAAVVALICGQGEGGYGDTVVARAMTHEYH